MAGSDYVGGWEGATPKSVSITCAWCGRVVEMTRIGPSVEVGREPMPNYIDEVVRVLATYLCPRDECHRPSLVEIVFYSGSGETWGAEVLGGIPRGRAVPMKGLLPEIEAVRQEAWSCFYGGDFRAAVVMGRAAVQRAVRTLGGEGSNIYDEIESLLEQGKVTQELKDWAHEVRIAAREAAHPEELGSVTREEARESLDWMDDFLRFAVALPARRAAAKEQPSA